MKKSLSRIDRRMIRNKRNRGVAIVFTLGILALLTVIALGFASTAILNRKLAENNTGQSYARHIARNVALPRVKDSLRRTRIAASIYSSKINEDSDVKDFLWKLDTSLYEPGTVKIYRTPAAPNVSWQYIKDTSAANKIIGRYAYVVVSASGRFDPIANGGVSPSIRYGNSTKELELPADWNELKDKFEEKYRWASYKEILKVSGASSEEQKKKIFEDGIAIGQQASPETYFVAYKDPSDTTKHDSWLREKKSLDDMFLRCNADWSDVVPTVVGNKNTAVESLI